ncbi:tRNA methyltransferase 112 -like protein [Toxocara canis]|uniref:Multifunctional methyltransferase subunit TRM112-like protein n=1 Tax=Toxocara canis TaxID=6265 RepID=A0A0B2VMZ7_TOXCA|nr:tRNA methyltransferase 112 -like protein [Toxocara canis]
MKLMTHNFLTSKFLKGVVTGYPLLLVATKKEVKEFEFNAEFVKRMIPKLDYPVLRQAAESIGEADGLPAEISTGWEDNEILLKKLHHVLVSVEVLEGELKCPETGRVFPIREGIPNMLVRENEVD